MLRLATALCCFTFLTPIAVSAQTRDPAGAEKLYEDGTRLLAADDWPGACAKFEASFKLDPAPGTQLNLASCAERDGKLALAWLRLKEARSLNADTKSASQRKQIEEFISASIERLSPKIPYLTINVPGAPDAVVLRNNQNVVTGVELPIDPGKHIIVVTAPGYVEQSRELEITVGQKQTLEIVLERTSGGAQVDPKESPQPTLPPKEPVVKPPTPKDDGGGLSGVQLGGIIIGSAGLATLGASFGLGAVALGKDADLDELGCEETDAGLRCPGDPTVASDLSSEGETFALASTITTFIGGAAVGAGVLMLILGAESSETTAMVVPVAGSQMAGVAVVGVFQ